jgi:hypothetical protein
VFCNHTKLVNALYILVVVVLENGQDENRFLN